MSFIYFITTLSTERYRTYRAAGQVSITQDYEKRIKSMEETNDILQKEKEAAHLEALKAREDESAINLKAEHWQGSSYLADRNIFASASLMRDRRKWSQPGPSEPLSWDRGSHSIRRANQTLNFIVV